MSSSERRPAIHAGNYYLTGVRRVLAKLAAMGIAVPADALGVPAFEGIGKPMAEFTRIEHAMLDWFTGRDYDQAQALIHYRPPGGEDHVIRILDEERCPRELTFDMLCPTRADAVAAVVFACDQDAVRVDAFRQEGEALVAVIDGADVVRIDPVRCEPFDRAVRDRVRTALKGVRRYDTRSLYARAARLPGFDNREHGMELNRFGRVEESCLFLGFPTNWAFAVRSALRQVQINVKQSQAQELAAVFFGASNWHQLVKHQDEPYSGVGPVQVTIHAATGPQERFYRTPEEAIFSVGCALKSYPEPVVIQRFDLTLDERSVSFRAVTRRAYDTTEPADRFFCPACIEGGGNDRWVASDDGDLAYVEAAQRIIGKLGTEQGAVSTSGALYAGDEPAATLAGLLGREGLPADHLVHLGDYAVAVFHEPEPNGGSLRTARVRIYRLEPGHGYRRGEDVAMYKARVRVVEAAKGKTLVIRPDYGHGAPIEIPVADVEQVRRLLALVHGEHLFTHSVPGIE